MDNDHIGVGATGGGQSGSVAAGASAVGWSAGQGWTVAGHGHAAACGTLKSWGQSRVINTELHMVTNPLPPPPPPSPTSPVLSVRPQICSGLDCTWLLAGEVFTSSLACCGRGSPPLCVWYSFVCYSCVATTFSFKWNKEELDLLYVSPYNFLVVC